MAKSFTYTFPAVRSLRDTFTRNVGDTVGDKKIRFYINRGISQERKQDNSMKNINDILTRLKKVKKIAPNEYEALCPVHNDTKPSLHISQNEDKILLHCKAGCSTESVMEKLGLRIADLFLDKKQSSVSNPTSNPIATFPYQNPDGSIRFVIKRFPNLPDGTKVFQAYMPDGRKGIGDTPRILYQAPEIIRAKERGGTVYVVEGEKDVETLRGKGLVATTPPFGASSKWLPQYTDLLKGSNVVIIPDTDPPGLKKEKEIVGALQGSVASLKLLELQGANDVTDWLDAGGTVEFLQELVKGEPEYTPPSKQNQPSYQCEGEVISWQLDNGIRFIASDTHQERTGIHARLEIHANGDSLSWGICNIDKHEDRVRLANAAYAQMDKFLTEAYPREQLRSDLDKFCLRLWDNYLLIFMPEMMVGSEDNQPLRFLLKPFILEGGGTILFAPPGRGKSYTALLWAVSVNAGVSIFWQTTQTPVLFINLERSKQSLERRLARVNKILGLDPKRPLLTLNARGKSLTEVLPLCRRAIKEHNIRLIVLDSISRAGFGDLTENRPVNAIIDALSGLCDSWLALGHTPRASEEHIYGGIHFEAGADVVVQLTSQQEEGGTLGIGFQSNKQNDIPPIPMTIYALEFSEIGLTNFRRAKPFEFPNIEERQKQSIDSLVKEYILEQETSDATATKIADALSANRSYVARMLRTSGKFVETRKEGREVYYGVKETNNV